MLSNTNELQKFTVTGSSGPIGEITDFLFDDTAWMTRYLVVGTGNWLSSRHVLISPIAINHLNRAEKSVSVALTQKQVENSPDIDVNEPLTRKAELEFYSYYGYPVYWEDVGLWAEDGVPDSALPVGEQMQSAGPELVKAYTLAEERMLKNDKSHLRSAKSVVGFHIKAVDGDIGHVQGLFVDEETWAIRYLIVDTSNWWLGHPMMITPDLIKHIDWDGRSVAINLTEQQVKDAPPYDPTVPLNREHEMAIHQYYGRPGYWVNPPPAKAKKSTRQSKKIITDYRPAPANLSTLAEASQPQFSQSQVSQSQLSQPPLSQSQSSSSESIPRPPISAEERRRMVEREAYFCAYSRGFSSGDPVKDWLTAEKRVDSRLTEA
jgi:Protein of unknown function (DUF2934)